MKGRSTEQLKTISSRLLKSPLFYVNTSDVAAASALFNVLPLDIIVFLTERVVEEILRVSKTTVGNEIYVVTGCRMLDRNEGVPDRQLGIASVRGLFQVRRPGVIVDLVGDRFRCLVVIVAVVIQRTHIGKIRAPPI